LLSPSARLRRLVLGGHCDMKMQPSLERALRHKDILKA